MTGNISTGRELVKLPDCEARLRCLSGRSHALMANRATIALVAILRALDLPEGSEVLMPVTLCANPANAVRLAGLRPLFADIDPSTLNMNLCSAEEMIGPQTRVILAIPLFGHALDCPSILDFATRHNLLVIEDAAQAVGLRHSDRPAGSLGFCSIYSFGSGKIADAGGGAAILADDPAFLARTRAHLGLISPGSPGNTNRERILAALDDLPRELRERGSMSLAYRAALDIPCVAHPQIPAGAPLWKYSVLLPARAARDRVTRALIAAGIPVTNLYPPLARYFPTARNHGATFPVAADVYDRIVNLPLWPPDAKLAGKVAAIFRANAS